MAGCGSTTVSVRTPSVHRRAVLSSPENIVTKPASKPSQTQLITHRNRQSRNDCTQTDTRRRLSGSGILGTAVLAIPHGFDYWNVFPVQGAHIDPEMIEMGERKKFNGYSADIVTDSSLNWLQNREADQPFFLMTTYKATHDPFFPNPKHRHLYTEEIPEPPTFNDDYKNRAAAAAMNTAKVSIMQRKNHLPEPIPEGLEGDDLKQWNYQCYMQNYLRCAHAIDENVGRLLDYLDAEGLAEDTIVIYSADHGFFLGGHGWYDKRFMYEESMRIPLLVRYPREIQAAGVSEQIVLNVDFRTNAARLRWHIHSR